MTTTPAPELTLTCFGIGDGLPIADRNHSAYLYSSGGRHVLLDCGEPISRSYKASGLSYDLVDNIIISHLHADHFGGLFMFLQSFWLEQRHKPLTIFLPADGIPPLRQMLRAAYLFDEALPFSMHLAALQPREPLALGPFLVTPYPTTHLEKARLAFQSKYPGDYQAYCFLLQTEGRRIAHSADLGAPQDLEPLLAQPLDLLVCELAHSQPEAMFRYLAGRAVRQILFVHVARYEWEHLDRLRHQAAEILKNMNCSFARDGEVVTLTSSLRANPCRVPRAIFF